MQKAGYGDIGSLDWVCLIHLGLHPHLIPFVVPLHQENPGSKHADGPFVPSREGVVGNEGWS